MAKYRVIFDKRRLKTKVIDLTTNSELPNIHNIKININATTGNMLTLDLLDFEVEEYKEDKNV